MAHLVVPPLWRFSWFGLLCYVRGGYEVIIGGIWLQTQIQSNINNAKAKEKRQQLNGAPSVLYQEPELHAVTKR
jgi:hypothetical protein